MIKIKQFFKKFWWLILVPVGLFLLTKIFQKDSSELKSLIKEKKVEIKKVDIAIKEKKVEVIKAKEKLKTEVLNTEEVVNTNLDNKEKRDEDAKQYFKDI